MEAVLPEVAPEDFEALVSSAAMVLELELASA